VTGVTLTSGGAGVLATVDGGPYAIVASAAQGSGLANYRITYADGRLSVTPATLTYVADPSTQFTGSSFPTFTGSVIGFVNGQTLTGATTGALKFTTTANAQSIPGNYAIDGSGLTANFGNYVFVQAPANATALTLNPAPTTPPSQFGPSSNGGPNTPQTNFNLSNPSNPTNGNVSRVSFTPNTTTGANTSTASNPTTSDVNTAALPPGDAYVHNNGRAFPPISQYDSDQYSDFKLPSYAPDDSEATVLTILARGIAQEKASKYMIDGFWNGADNTWPGPGNIDLHDKATFSDGAGRNATPTNDPGFPIVTGQTDIAALLKSGPVMIGASSAQPVQWMLATGMAPDGKGIICDDTMTGKLVALAWDPATRTVGGVTKIFDAKSNTFVLLADASNAIPTSDASGLAGLQTFVPSTYYAVTVH
jgi:hypothetical protein